MSRPRSLANISDIDPALNSINLLVFAHPGEGKTVFWGTGDESVLLLDSDNGFQSAKAQGSKCYRMPVMDYDELQEAYEYCKTELKKDLPSVRWVVWDSLTLFQDRVLIDDFLVDDVADNPRQEVFVPSKREYQINMNMIGRYVRLFSDLPFNFGISCHVDDEGEDHEGNKTFMPQIQGKKMPSKISGYMNVVGYLAKANVKEGDKEKKVQRLLTKRVGKFYAKDRFDALGSHIDKPTLPKIEELIIAKRANKKSASPAAVRRKPLTNRKGTK